MGTIEDIIKQKKFTDEYQKALIGVSSLASMLEYTQLKFFKQFEITPQQYNVLRILRGQYPKPAMVSLVKERMIDQNSDASRIVERLRKGYFVERVVNETDRRAVDIVITQKGLDLLKKIDRILSDVKDPIRTLDKVEIVDFNEMLDKILSRWLKAEEENLA